MSIIWSLKKLFDPITHAREEREKKAEREQPERPDSGEPPRFEMEPGGPGAKRDAPERFRCRVCGLVGTDSVYCPECLADTMAAVE